MRFIKAQIDTLSAVEFCDAWIESREEELLRGEYDPWSEENVVEGITEGFEKLTDAELLQLSAACRAADQTVVGRIVMAVMRRYWDGLARSRADSDYEKAKREAYEDCPKHGLRCNCPEV